MAKLRVIPGGRDAAAQFERFIGPHMDALYRSAYRFTRNAADAEDLVQEVCVRAYPRLEELKGMDNPRAWLLCVLYRVFVDLRRHRDSSPLLPAGAVDADALTDRLAGSEPGPEAQTESAIIATRLEHAWQRLDRTQRALLALHDVEGYTLAELEEMTGLRVGTLKSRLHRARARLGRLLNGESATPLAFASEG